MATRGQRKNEFKSSDLWIIGICLVSVGPSLDQDMASFHTARLAFRSSALKPWIMTVKDWMNWEGGVDLIAKTAPELELPNVVVHVARMVHTPVGSAPAGIVLWQPDPAAPPAVCGFVCPDQKVGAYFGPRIFAGTPFEQAPALDAQIEIVTGPDACSARVEVAGHVFETSLTGLAPADLIQREPTASAPFTQQGLEAPAAAASLKVNGKEVEIVLPPEGITGGPCAVFAPCGLYAR